MEEETHARHDLPEIGVDASPEMRRGVYANIVMAQTMQNGMVQLSFVDVDAPSDDGNARGVLVSRVYMAPPDVISLRDMLVKHTQSWKVEVDGTKA